MMHDGLGWVAYGEAVHAVPTLADGHLAVAMRVGAPLPYPAAGIVHDDMLTQYLDDVCGGAVLERPPERAALVSVT